MFVNLQWRRVVDKSRQELAELIAPGRCLFCGGAVPDLSCAACTADLPFNDCACPGCAEPQVEALHCAGCLRRPPAFDGAWTAFLQETPIRESIHQLKYGARLVQARWLGQQMAAGLRARRMPLPDLLIPVPLHRGRLWRRGYNQALELTRAIARELGLPVDAHAARRLRATADQIGLSAAARRRNLKNAFVASRDLSGLHVALIDDVMTTGATLDALARACRQAGAMHIEAWAAARAE